MRKKQPYCIQVKQQHVYLHKVSSGDGEYGGDGDGGEVDGDHGQVSV